MEWLRDAPQRWWTDEEGFREFIADWTMADRAYLEQLRLTWELPTLLATALRVREVAQHGAATSVRRRGGTSASDRSWRAPRW